MAEYILIAALVLTAVALVLGLYRLLVGPCVVTRAISLDLLTPGVHPVAGRRRRVRRARESMSTVALVYAVLSFLGVLALARYLEKGL